MKRGTKEFYELQAQFEKDAKSLNLCPCNFTKETSESVLKNGYYYTNGEVNTAFKGYMSGYSFMRSKANIGDF